MGINISCSFQHFRLRRARRCNSKTRSFLRGVVAQLVERLVRNEKVAGSIPVDSTSLTLVR